ncbi:MAG: PAS domain-containing protein [Acidobacteriia bacterium]|nr:PAS domain-containing protein [Terriglobia bacterium]
MLESELFSLLEGTADAAFTVDEQGIIRSWNRAAEKLFGYPSSAVLQKSCASLFQGHGPQGNIVCKEDCNVLQCAAARREMENYDLQLLGRGGRQLWVNISIIVFRDARSGRRLHIHLARDITSREKKDELARKVLGAARELAALQESPAALAPVSPLTVQEKRVLSLFSEGKSPQQVARTLKITDRTLRNHLHHANRKLGTRNRLEAVIHAAKRGLL